MRWINHAGTALIGVVFVLGPPLATVVWIRSQGWQRPTATQVRGWFEQPLTAGMIVALIVCVAVMVWLLLVYLILRQGWSAFTVWVRRLRRMPLPSAAQMTAGSMAGVAAIAMPAVVVPHQGVAVPSATSHTDQAEPAVHPAASETAPAGIALPGGGWVPYRTALAVTALSALIWLHRRQHYQPGGPRFAQHDRDADLRPLPPTAQAITAAADTDQSPHLPGPDAMLLPDLPTGLLTLSGPGAVSAARGLLTTVMLGSALAGTVSTLVTVGRHDWELLLGDATADDLPAGLQIGDTGAAVPHTPRWHGGDFSGWPSPTLVLTRRPGLPTSRAADGEATDRGADAVTVVVVGEQRLEGTDHLLDGNGWVVADDGTVTGTDSGRPLRLCTLDQQAAGDLLLLVQQHTRSASAPTARPIAPQALPHPDPRRRPVAELSLLGGCRLQVQGRPVHVRRSAGLQVLAYLAVHPDGATTIELIRALWPGLAPTTITKRLHTTLTDLRRQLQPPLDDVIIRHDERYRLNPDLIDTDLDQLRQAITAAGTAVTDRQRQVTAHTIIDTYRGELAAGFSWPWLARAREALRRDVIDAYLQLAAISAPAETLDLVQAATAVDPYNEALHDHAERVLRAAGHHDAAAALRHGLTQRLLIAGLRPVTAPTDRGQ